MAPHGSGLSEARVACDFRTRPNCEFSNKLGYIAACVLDLRAAICQREHWIIL